MGCENLLDLLKIDQFFVGFDCNFEYSDPIRDRFRSRVFESHFFFENGLNFQISNLIVIKSCRMNLLALKSELRPHKRRLGLDQLNLLSELNDYLIVPG